MSPYSYGDIVVCHAKNYTITGVIGCLVFVLLCCDKFGIYLRVYTKNLKIVTLNLFQGLSCWKIQKQIRNDSTSVVYLILCNVVSKSQKFVLQNYFHSL